MVFPPLFGYLSNGIRKQTPQNWPFLRPALWHSGKFSHTDEGELEPDLALEPPCNCSQSDASDLAVRRLPLSPTVPFVPTHKPMSFKTLGNVGVGVGGGNLKWDNFIHLVFPSCGCKTIRCLILKMIFLFICLFVCLAGCTGQLSGVLTFNLKHALLPFLLCRVLQVTWPTSFLPILPPMPPHLPLGVWGNRCTLFSSVRHR